MVFKIEPIKLNLKYYGKAVNEVAYKSGTKHSLKYIKDEIAQLQYVARKKKQDVQFEVALKYSYGWRSGQLFGVNDDISHFDPDNITLGSGRVSGSVKRQSSFNEFVVYILPLNHKKPLPKYFQKPKGGDSEYNDCLYQCILQTVGNKSLIAKGWRTPYDFKKKLNIGRNDKVHIDKLSEIELGLKININCSGDYKYVSKGIYDRVINIKLNKEHYKLDKSDSTGKKYKVQCNKKPVVFYEIKNEMYYLISQNKEWELKFTNQYLDQIDDSYFYINKTKETQEISTKSKKCKVVTLRELFDEFVEARQNIYKGTDGFIDLFETPLPQWAAQRVTHFKNATSMVPESFKLMEAEWHNYAFTGALSWIKEKKKQYENVYSYDQNSMYSYYLQSEKFMIAYKQGIFSQVENTKQTYYSYGIYRAIVTSVDESKNKYFRFNKLNYYTHYDLSNALELNMNVELIQDDEPNALLYDSKSRTYGHRAYENTIKYLFELKDKCKYVKRILSSFWGSMMEKNKRTVILSDTEVDITDDKEICGIRKYDNCTKVKYLKTDKIFKTDYARVGAFLTSYCRLQMQKFITKNFDDENVIRIHTDSVTVLSQKLDKKLISNDIGAFKLEHKGDCYIEHINVVKWT